MAIKWLTIAELALYSRLSPSTLKRAIGRDGGDRLPSYLIAGRRLVRAEDYERWVESQQRPTASAMAQSILARLAA